MSLQGKPVPLEFVDYGISYSDAYQCWYRQEQAVPQSDLDYMFCQLSVSQFSSDSNHPRSILHHDSYEHLQTTVCVEDSWQTPVGLQK